MSGLKEVGFGVHEYVPAPDWIHPTDDGCFGIIGGIGSWGMCCQKPPDDPIHDVKEPPESIARQDAGREHLLKLREQKGDTKR